MIPDKPGWWWIARDHHVPRVIPLLVWVDPTLVELRCIDPDYSYGAVSVSRAAGQWLAPVLRREQADELQRHAAALEAQIEDLEQRLFLDHEFMDDEGYRGSHKIAEAMRDE